MRSLPRSLILCCVLAACSGEQAALVATDVVITAPVPGMRMGAAYLALHNNSAQPVRISRVASPELESVELHESVLEDGIARMHSLAEVVIPAGRSLRFAAGHKHLMLRYRSTVPDSVTLQFFDDDTLLLAISVATPE